MTTAGSEATLASTDATLAAFAESVGAEEPIAVEGCRTRWLLGGELTSGTRLVGAPSGIVQYRPEEMTIAVRAGTSVADLDAALAERGQRSALPARGGTVGGALAVGENDLRAQGRGLLRTALLQVRYVSAEGRIITSGGPTVKNVTGFDLPRLMVGSLGTLGLLAEVILRTNPIPAVSRWLRADGVDPQRAIEAVIAPSAVLWDGTSTWVQLEGHGVDVDAEQRALASIGSFAEIDGPPELPPHRWSLTPAELPGLAGHTSEPDDGSGPERFVAVVGLGLVFADRPQPARSLAPELATIAGRLKHNFDPTGRLNPGRDPSRR
ncbi:MAG: FAD-binding protein [Acidimicrobiia bacterium]|nr:FAD-binding protein [Acidimicrobiia bacterium]